MHLSIIICMHMQIDRHRYVLPIQCEVSLGDGPVAGLIKTEPCFEVQLVRLTDNMVCGNPWVSMFFFFWGGGSVRESCVKRASLGLRLPQLCNCYVGRTPRGAVKLGMRLMSCPRPFRWLILQHVFWNGLQHPTLQSISFKQNWFYMVLPRLAKRNLLESHGLGLLEGCWTCHWHIDCQEISDENCRKEKPGLPKTCCRCCWGVGTKLSADPSL